METVTASTYLATLTEVAESLFSTALDFGTQALAIPVVQVFLGITIAGVAISLVARAIHSIG